MRYLFIIFFLFLAVSCGGRSDDYDEIAVFRVDCIDGIMQISSVDGFECKYIPVHNENNEMVRCWK